jgi:hypothetical protein
MHNLYNFKGVTFRTESCHVGHTGTRLITKVKQRWARLGLGGVTRESRPGAVGSYFRILWPGSGHGLATKEGCRTRCKSRNLEYAMGVRSTGFTT